MSSGTHTNQYHLMDKGIIGLLGLVIGSLITGIFKWMTSNNASTINDRTKFRNDILRRLEQVEERTKHLEEEVTIWKIRYWSLYARTLERFNVTPPDFHKMDLNELEKGYKKAVEKLSSIKNKQSQSD